jgi:hypothetical protein
MSVPAENSFGFSSKTLQRKGALGLLALLRPA